MIKALVYTTHEQGNDGPEFVCPSCIIKFPQIANDPTLKVHVAQEDDKDGLCSACFGSIF